MHGNARDFPASKFNRSFDRYQMRASARPSLCPATARSPATSSARTNMRSSGASGKAVEFCDRRAAREKPEAIHASRMDARHIHLDAMLDPNNGAACRALARSPGSHFLCLSLVPRTPAGREQGQKYRPSPIVLAVERGRPL